MPTTNAQVREAFEEYRIVRVLDEDPDEGDIEAGAIWYHSGDNEWRAYDGTDFGSLDFSADA